MDKRIQNLKSILLDTVPFFFSENGFGDISLEDVVLSYQSPSERALDFIECNIIGDGDENLTLNVHAPRDLFYAQHKPRIQQIDDLVYAKFMSKKVKETVLTRSSISLGRGSTGTCIEKQGRRPMMAIDAPDACGRALFDANPKKEENLSSGGGLRPFSLKKPKLRHGAEIPTEEGGSRTGESAIAKRLEPHLGKEDSTHAIKEILRGMLDDSDTKRPLHLLQTALSSTYLSNEDIIQLCDFSFDMLHSNTESLLQVYFIFLDRIDKTELPATFPSVLNLVESYLLNSTNLHYIFRIFRKVHPPRVLNLLELVLKRIYEVDIGIKLIALDILLKESSTPAFFEELISLYDHVDQRKVEGMDFRHFAIIKCFSSCIVPCKENASDPRDTPNARPDTACEKGSHAASSLFSEDSYIKCTNTIFSSLENSCLRGVVASCLKKLRTCGLSRTFVIAFIVFNINRLRPTKKYPSIFLLSVFGKFLGLSHGLKERIFETVDEEIVYRGILKLNNTSESLVYVTRAVFMFLLRLLKRSKVVRKGFGAHSGPETDDAECRRESTQANGGPKAGTRSSSACTSTKMTHAVGKIIRALLKVDIEYIGLSPREKIAVVEILKSHFPFQSPFIKELMVAFLDALGYQNIFGLLKNIANDTNTIIRKKVFERLLRFFGDSEKLPDIVRIYFSLLRDKCYSDVKFCSQALAKPFYFEEDKSIAKHFHLSDVNMDTLEKAVLIKHYAKYNPEEVSLEAAVGVLDDTEMVKVKKNSEYVNTILKIVANLLRHSSENVVKCPVSRGIRKKLETFCNQFIFYDVYVSQCAKVLRLLGYSSLGGCGDYYSLINACLGNKIEIRPSSIHGKKALLAYLDHHPEEILVLRRHVIGLFKNVEVLPDLLKLLLTHIHPPETDGGPRCASLEGQKSSTTAELYFNFVSTYQECIFAVADTEQPIDVLVLAYRLLVCATHIGAVLSQLSVPRILGIIYRCGSLSADRIVMLYAKDIINTLQDTLGFVLGIESKYCQRKPELHLPETERRCILGEIFSSIRCERDRLLFVEKLVSLANTGNVFYIAKALVRLEMDAKEAKALNICIKEAMQSILFTESSDMENMHNIAIAYVLSQYKNMLRTRKCAANLGEAERLAEIDEYTEHEKRFILELGNSIQLFM